MLKQNSDRPKFISISMAILLSSSVLCSLANSSQTAAQSLAENPQANEQTTATDSPTLNQPSPDSTDTSKETRQQDNDLFFNPPPLGSPKRTADAGARDDCPKFIPTRPKTLQHATLLIPDDRLNHAATTVSGYPTFVWYLAKYSNLKSVTFYLSNQGETTIIFHETKPVSTETPGIMRFQLPDNEPPLEVGKWYSWKLLISKTEEAPDSESECIAYGYIGRRPLHSTEQAELNAASNPEEMWNFYVKELIWYDALATLDRMRRDHPEDESIQRRWEAFLGFIGLGDLSEYPLYKTYPNLPIKSETLMSNTFDASFNSCFYQGSRLALVHRRQFGRSSTYFFQIFCRV